MQLTATILCREASEWMLIFSGYGQDPLSWKEFAHRCQPDFNVMVISLPSGSGIPVVTKPDFCESIRDLMEQHGMKAVTVISYSMGSRFSLVMAECMPERIRMIIMMAPDGILRLTWNRVATNTFIGHWLFRQFVFHETVYLALIGLGYKLGLLTKSLYSFSKWYMRDRAAREKVYDTWMLMRKMQPDLENVNQHQQQYGFAVLAYFGMKDAVIRPQAAKRLRLKIRAANIVMLDKGHQLMDAEMPGMLASAIADLHLMDRRAE